MSCVPRGLDHTAFTCRSRNLAKDYESNKDQVKGTAKNVAGKIQEQAGKLLGNKDQQAKGLQHQAEGKIQQQVGNFKEVVADIKKL